jgi:hypothetical protein
MSKQLKKQKEIALLTALVFVAVFSALSVGMFTMSHQNTLAARNLHASNTARSSADSGLEVVRYYMSQVAIPGTVPVSQRFAHVVNAFTGSSSVLPAAYHCTLSSDGSTILLGTLQSPVVLNDSESFYAEIRAAGNSGMEVRVRGASGQIERRITAGFTYGTRPSSVFDYGVATKGPLELDGGTLTGYTVRAESDVYVESLNNNNALGVLKKKSEIAGKAKIVNPDAIVTVVGKIGGYTGSEAIEKSVEVGVTPTEFPYPNASQFEQYATGGYYESGKTLTNMKIRAGTNPSFAGGTVIQGILYVESPNTLEFKGNVKIEGMIVCEGDWNDDSGTNKLAFTGSVDSYGLPAGTQFDAMRSETGTFVMAPGFEVSFWGAFGTVNGAISGNGIKFGGNAGGIVEGSVINYSDTTMTVVGSSDIIFNRSGITKIPSGFVQETVIHYNPSVYEEEPAI